MLIAFHIILLSISLYFLVKDRIINMNTEDKATKKLSSVWIAIWTFFVVFNAVELLNIFIGGM